MKDVKIQINEEDLIRLIKDNPELKIEKDYLYFESDRQKPIHLNTNYYCNK